MRKHTKDSVVGFYTGKDGETHPITKSQSDLRKKFIVTKVAFTAIVPRDKAYQTIKAMSDTLAKHKPKGEHWSKCLKCGYVGNVKEFSGGIDAARPLMKTEADFKRNAKKIAEVLRAKCPKCGWMGDKGDGYGGVTLNWRGDKNQKPPTIMLR